MHRALLIVAALLLAFVPVSQALHTPGSWYDISSMDTNGNRVEDVIDAMSPDSLVDCIIGFLDDCVDSVRVAELAILGNVRYRSPVVATVQVTDIRAHILTDTVATWPEVGQIWFNHIAEPHMTTAGQALKAHAGYYSPNTAEDAGFDGSGITIAILDTGVDPHNDLPTAVGGVFIDASNNLVVGDPGDDHMHGTAVAGCALGRGDGSGDNRGTAPGASLFDGRITPPGSGGTTSFTNIQQVVDYVKLNASSFSPPIRVANISFGSQGESDGTGVGGFLVASIEALVASGVVVCVSAGNHHLCPNPCGIGVPAVTSRAITVGAMSDENTFDRGDDVLANYSRRGPGIGPVPKPDVCAYGNQCPAPAPISCPCAACAGPNSVVIRTTSFNSTTGYIDFGGTSAASPMVAGTAALVIESNPSITATAVKDLLMNTADPGAGTAAECGAGLVDLGPIFSAPPANCDLAIVGIQSPNQVNCFQPVTVTGTVKNVGATTVSDFSVEFTRWYFGPNGNPPDRFPLVSAPVQNIGFPLAPGAQRDFSVIWTPGVDPYPSLPLSQHSCFWATVNAACDNSPGNNERNRNVTIAGLTGTSCITTPPVAETALTLSATREIKFRVGNPFDQAVQVDLALENPDPANWYAEIVVNGNTSNSALSVDVDNLECAVFGTLRATPVDTTYAPANTLRLVSTSSMGDIGEFEVVVGVDSEDIPTLQEWAVFVVALLLLTSGAATIRRVRRREVL